LRLGSRLRHMRALHVAAVLAGFMVVAVIGSSLRAQATQFELVALPVSLTNGVNTIDVGEIDVGEIDVGDIDVGGSPNSLDRVLLNDGTGSFTELLGAAPQALVGLELHAQALLQEVTGPLGLRLTPMLSTTIQ
jgi:hypothetical protein